MLPSMKSGTKIKNCWVGISTGNVHGIELTATEPMDHESLVTSQAMYAYDDDSRKYTFEMTFRDRFYGICQG